MYEPTADRSTDVDDHPFFPPYLIPGTDEKQLLCVFGSDSDVHGQARFSSRKLDKSQMIARHHGAPRVSTYPPFNPETS